VRLSPAAVRGARLDAELGAALATLAERVSRVYVHVDLDVLDPSVWPANSYAPPGGLSLDDLQAALQRVAERTAVTGATLAAYDPACDPEGATLRAGLALAATLAGAARV
jgi:arginase